MISVKQIRDVVRSYNKKEITIGALGSHSALDIADGAKDEGFRTIAVCQKGRERPYLHYKRIFDEVIILDKFSKTVGKDVQEKLRQRNTIFIPHRSFTTYVSYDDIENEFLVPLFGNRAILRAEERDAPRNQYYLLEKANIRMPRVYEKPEDVDGPAIVKVQEAKRKIERAFFTISSYDDYKKKAEQRVKHGIITWEELEKAKIEELVIGTYFNFNFFYSPLKEEVEFLGIDRRLQTNLYDFVNLPSQQQLELDVQLQNIEVGHMPATIRESLLEKVFEIGERFVEVAKREYPPGIIGPFALQSVVTKDLEIVVYDVSPRVPGSPIIATTSPYTKYYYGFVVSTGRRIAMEIKEAIKQGRLEEVVT
jgi:5-formaminoimidazole-4-carboxamide-1-(beta)-D-ribofuranosyl 5'-monophosphate synthetase